MEQLAMTELRMRDESQRRNMPLIGTPLAVFTWGYGAILATTALQATHVYETKRAFATWAVPLVIFLGLTICALLWEASVQ